MQPEKEHLMRKNLLDQLPLTPATVDHRHAQELATISAVLDHLPEAVRLVHEDLSWRGRKRIDPTRGRDGMAAEQVLRVAILKQMTGFSYEQLAFHLTDSNTYRTFCRLSFAERTLKKSRLQKNVKRVKAETWEAINKMVLLKAKELDIEAGDKVRTDCTVVESNIHHPTDNSLLCDCVRVLVRIMGNAKDEFGIAFTNHSRRAKRRSMKISNAKSLSQRKPLYRDLIKVTDMTIAQAEQVSKQLQQVVPASIVQAVLAEALIGELKQYIGLAHRVVSQAERRVLRGESVPANEKLFSIFETHTDIIIKDNRDPEYGHKICLSTGPSGLVTDLVVEEGNPADSTLATRTIERLKALFGKAPRQASFDGGFASRANLADIKALGVKDVAFNKRCGLEITDMVKSKPIYRALSAFRSGIEGTISFLKPDFGLARCLWRGFASFNAYAHASVLACNLLVLVRHMLGPAA
jgi:IS5 family transposase